MMDRLIGIGAEADIGLVDAFGLKAPAHVVRDGTRGIKPHQSLLAHLVFFLLKEKKKPLQQSLRRGRSKFNQISAAGHWRPRGCQ
jgi:hypothetical protein